MKVEVAIGDGLQEQKMHTKATFEMTKNLLTPLIISGLNSLTQNRCVWRDAG